MADNETEEMFIEVQNEGMDIIGTRVEFELDGKSGYSGVANNPEPSTQMLTGGYQGYAEMVIYATKSQFAATPAQKGIITVTWDGVFRQSLWNRKQVDTFGASHYAITVMRQLPFT